MGGVKTFAKKAISWPLLLLSLLPLSPVVGEGSLFPPVDLSISDISIVPDEFGYDVSIDVVNLGGSVSRATRISIWDEFDVVSGNGALVLDSDLDEVQPGKVRSITLEWVPRHTSVHRLWVMIDPEGDLLEPLKSNNMDFRLVELPPMPDVRTSVDADLDEERIGSFFKGVPLELEVMVDPGENLDRSQFAYGLFMDNMTHPLRTGTGGAPMELSFEIGGLEEGPHTVTLNCSYAGVPIGGRTFGFDVLELPEWSRDLSDLQVRFDEATESYSLEGGLDVPELEIIPDLPGMEVEMPVEFFSQPNEISVTGHILPDLTTTFDIRFVSGTPMSTDGSPMRSSIKVFSPRPYVPDGTALSASLNLSFELSDLLGNGPIDIGQGMGCLPADPFTMTAEGKIDVDVGLSHYGNGSFSTISTAVLALSGISRTVNFPSVPIAPGAVAVQQAALDWRTSHVLSGGLWATDGVFNISRSFELDDLWGTHAVSGATAFVTGSTHSSISKGLRGPTVEVHITPVEGGGSILGLWKEESSVLIRENAFRMAEPTITPIGDSGHLTVWTEEVNGTAPSAGRTTHRSLMWLLTDGSLVVMKGPEHLFNGSHLDMSPCLATSDEGSDAVLTWERDGDGDRTTEDDSSLMVSSFNGTGWTGPSLVKEGQILSSTCLFSTEKGPIVAWVEPNGTVWAASMDEGKTVSGKVNISLPYGSKAIEISTIATGPSSILQGGFLIVRNGTESEDRYVLSADLLSAGPGLRTVTGWVIAGSDHLIERPVGERLDGGYCAVMWREASPGGGRVMMAASPSGSDLSYWTPPLTVSEEGPVQTSHSFSIVSEGTFWTSIGSVRLPGDEGTDGPLRISKDRMTGAADIGPISVAVPDGYSAGDIATVKATLTNRGLEPNGIASVLLNRVLRSRENGTITEQPVSAQQVVFNGLGSEREVNFPVTIEDMQLGYAASTMTVQGLAPYHSSSIFCSLPAFPDPVVSGMEVEEGLSDGNITVKITVVNMGHSRLASHPLLLMAKGPQRPVAFEGSQLEPVGFRGMVGGSIVSSLNISIDPSQEVTCLLGFGPGNGTTALWAEIGGIGWSTEPPRSSEPLVLRRFPHMDLEMHLSRTLQLPEGPVQVNISITNRGMGGEYEGTLEEDAALLPDGMRYLDPGSSFELFAFNGSSNLVLGSVLDAPLPGRTDHLSVTLPTELVVPGRSMLELYLSSECGLQGVWGPDPASTLEVLVPLPVDLKLSEPREMRMPSIGSGFSVNVDNPTGRSVWGVVATLYNGRPEDEVLLYSNVLVQIGPGSMRETFLPHSLNDGNYLLSVSIETYPAHAQSKDEGTIRLDDGQFEYEARGVRNEGPGGSGPETDEVLRSAIVAGAATFSVLAVAIGFRLKGSKEDEGSE